MKVIILVVFVILQSFILHVNCSNCNCLLGEYCAPLNVTSNDRVEFIGFSNNSTGNYLKYDYYSVTTIAVSYNDGDFDIPEELVCISHANNIRLVWSTIIQDGQLLNKTYVKNLINGVIDNIQNQNMDGVIYELGNPLKIDNIEASQMLTFIVQETYNTLKEINSNYQVAIKIPYTPRSDDGYDYLGLDDSTDYLIVMEYNIGKNGNGANDTNNEYCLAGANSPNNLVREGVIGYQEIGIPESKLILTYPWFGLDFKCINENGDANLTTVDCEISIKSNDGPLSDCSDEIQKLSTPIGYGDILKTIEDRSIENGGLQWNGESNSPFFNYYDKEGVLHQVWFDDPDSLSDKVWLTKGLKVRGIGAFNMDNLNFNDLVSSYYMYDTMAIFFA